MVVEAQNMVDEAKDNHKSKSVDIVVQCENDQLRQMDIWEDKTSMVLLIGGHLEVGIYDTSNIKRLRSQ